MNLAREREKKTSHMYVDYQDPTLTDGELEAEANDKNLVRDALLDESVVPPDLRDEQRA